MAKSFAYDRKTRSRTPAIVATLILLVLSLSAIFYYLHTLRLERESLEWSAKTPMLGENEPGLVFYNHHPNQFRQLLDEKDGGESVGARIAAAGFKVIKVYLADHESIDELATVSRKLHRQYGLKFLTVLLVAEFKAQRPEHMSEHSPFLDRVIPEFVSKLGKYPWIAIQLNNEDHFYLEHGPLAGRPLSIAMSEKEHYQYYDSIAGRIRSELKARAPKQEWNKPILFGQGLFIDFEQDWRLDLEQRLNLINQMVYIDALAINLYLQWPKMYPVVLALLSQHTDLPIVVGEFGKSRYDLSPELQFFFNNEVWWLLVKEMEAGRCKGAVLFAWDDKPAGGNTPGDYDGEKPFDRVYGIRTYLDQYRATLKKRYYQRLTRLLRPLAPSDYTVRESFFWKVSRTPERAVQYFTWYITQNEEAAAAQQAKKARMLRRGARLTAAEIKSWRALNYVGAALYFRSVVALYNDDFRSLAHSYRRLATEFPDAQIHDGGGGFWSPLKTLKTQIELVRDTISDSKSRSQLVQILRTP